MAAGAASAPYHNARAHGRVTLTRAGSSDDVDVVEVDSGEAAPVLKRYLSRWWPAVAPYFKVGPSDPVEAFAAEAARHPVFRLQDRTVGRRLG